MKAGIALVLLAMVAAGIISFHPFAGSYGVGEKTRNPGVTVLRTIQSTEMESVLSARQRSGSLPDIFTISGYPPNYFIWNPDGSGNRGRYRFRVFLPDKDELAKCWRATAWPVSQHDQHRLPAYFIDQGVAVYESLGSIDNEPMLERSYVESPFTSLIKKDVWQLLPTPSPGRP